MARTRNKLTSLAISRLKDVGEYMDGGGLRLQITHGVDGDFRRSWLLRFRAPSGRVREMGLGSAEDVSLASARVAAEAAREAARSGVDPIEAKKTKRAEAAAEIARAVTFKRCAEMYLDAHEASWRNEKHRKQWHATLKT